MTDLSSLARTLAERLITQKCEYRGGDAPFGWSADAHEVYALDKLVLQTENKKRADKCYAELIIKAETVIREAIDKTLEEAEAIAFKAGSADTRSMQGAHAAAAAIRSLKQSNSGMEVRK
jgi:hypothetical protein